MSDGPMPTSHERADERLRQAIEARTTTVQPSVEAGLDRISEKLEATTRLPRAAGAPRSPRPQRPPWLLVAAALVLLVAVAGGLLVVREDDGDRVDVIDQPDRPATTATTGTTAPPTTATTEAPDSGASTTVPSTPGPITSVFEIPQDILVGAVWPRPSSDVRFDDPVAAARSFARYLAHYANPVVGEFRPGDARSGEVPVRPTARGPETTVLVRQLSDDHWYVIGSATEDIVVDRPASGEQLFDSRQPLTGRALAFEGTVHVELLAYLADGRHVSLGETIVTGSGSPPAGPFTGSLEWSPASADMEPVGVLIFSTADESAETGGTWQAVAVPVRLVPDFYN